MMKHVRTGLRKAGSALVDEVRAIPALSDPDVRRYFSSRANVFFFLSAAVLFAVAWPTSSMTHDVPAYAMPAVAAAIAWPVALGWSAPVVGWAISLLAAMIIGSVVPTVGGWPWSIQVTHIIAILVLSFMAALRCPLRWLPVIWLASTLVMTNSAPDDQRPGWIFGLTFGAIVIALVRGLLASRRQLAERTQETRAAESEAAVLQERARIARDLHDVVAHRMSMVVVMAQTARYRLPDVSDAAAAEFDAIAVAARTSLDEVRQLLGVLREPDDTSNESSARTAPNPGLEHIESLVEATRRAGADVQLHLAPGTDVGEASGLAVYRIVQESLANATRHAPGARTDIWLRDGAQGQLELAVVNGPGTEPPLNLAGNGAGIPGMTDRARSVGGSLVTALTPDGGFAVRAWVPSGNQRAIASSDPTATSDPTASSDPVAWSDPTGSSKAGSSDTDSSDTDSSDTER